MSDHSTSTTAPAPTERLYALIAEFSDVDSVMSAAEKCRDAGFTRWDVHTPFPVHGIDGAMGIRPTVLPWITLTCGLTGLATAIVYTWSTNAITIPGLPTSLQGYEFLISGKPLWSFPANVPIMFELTVLFAAFSTIFGMLLLNRLPMHYNPLFKSDRFRRATADRFFVVIEASDPLFDERKTGEFLSKIGGAAIEKVMD